MRVCTWYSAVGVTSFQNSMNFTSPLIELGSRAEVLVRGNTSMRIEHIVLPTNSLM